MISNARFCVLLAAYNGAKYIEQQIDSILAQENIQVTIIISVDHSIDGTKELIETVYRINPNVIVLEDITKIGGAAKNFFRLMRDVDLSSFDYLAFADQDDVWYTDKLYRAASKLQETKSDGYSSNVIAFWENGKEKLIVKSQPQCKYDFLFEAAGPGCTYVVTNRLGLSLQQAILKYQNVLEKVWFHDWFIYAYARANGFTWIIDEIPSMHYRQHAHNVVGINQGIQAFLHRCKKILFKGGFFQVLLIVKVIEMKQDCFVAKWQTLDRFAYLYLAVHAYQCRRRFKEKVFFFFACLFMSIIHPKIEPIEVYK